MPRFIFTSLLLFLIAGCQNQQQPMNPFAVYGPQRLPPPATQSYGQPAATAPYYQGPAANVAPSLNGQQQPPAQFNPPPSTYPAPQGMGAPASGYQQGPASSYQQGQWRGVSQSSSSGDVIPASHTEEVSADTPPRLDDDAKASAVPLRGMRVNEVTEVSQPLSPSPISAAPTAGWSSVPQPAVSGDSHNMPAQPSRIP